jgi:hypothetical protein
VHCLSVSINPIPDVRGNFLAILSTQLIEHRTMLQSVNIHVPIVIAV